MSFRFFDLLVAAPVEVFRFKPFPPFPPPLPCEDPAAAPASTLLRGEVKIQNEQFSDPWEARWGHGAEGAVEDDSLIPSAGVAFLSITDKLREREDDDAAAVEKDLDATSDGLGDPHPATRGEGEEEGDSDFEPALTSRLCCPVSQRGIGDIEEADLEARVP